MGEEPTLIESLELRAGTEVESLWNVYCNNATECGEHWESREEMEETEIHRGTRQNVSSIEEIDVCARE